MTSTASMHIQVETSPLIAELSQRLSVLGELVPRPVEIIERIRGMVYAGQYERAAREFCDVIRDALGTAI